MPGNIIHFIYGILLCYCLTNHVQLPAWLGKFASIVPAILLASTGKTLFSNYGINAAGSFSWVVLFIGPPVMTLGFCWLIYISLVNNLGSKIIGNRVLVSLGRISYSFYLWHEFILKMVYSKIERYLAFGGLNTIILFITTLIVLLPVSYISYSIFERFYFRINKQVL